MKVFDLSRLSSFDSEIANNDSGWDDCGVETVEVILNNYDTRQDDRRRTTALRGGLYKCTGGECELVVQGPSRPDYTLVLASVMVVLCAGERPFD